MFGSWTWRLVACALVGFSVVSLTPQAHAGLILAGDSNSSNFSNCTGNCSGSTSSSIILGSTAPPNDDSMLSIVDTSFSTLVNVTALPLAELSLTVGNKPGAGEGTLSFDYNLVLTFSTPSGSSSEVFDMALSGDGVPGTGTVTLSGFTLNLPDPLVLAGVTLSNFRFIDSGAAGTFSNGIWTVSGNAQTADLILVADVADPPAPIPEPNSLAMFGAGLVLLGAVVRMSRFPRR